MAGRSRPYVNWSQFSNIRKELPPEPVINIKEELIDSDEGYGVFRRLSHKVTGSRYDVPFEHKLIVAYAERPGSYEPVGVISFRIAVKSEDAWSSGDFMSDFFHKISFLFVDRAYQRKGVGSRLLQEALKTIQSNGLKRPIHLEAAKSAVKFFEKNGFALERGVRKTTGQGRGLFRKIRPMFFKF